MVPDIYFYLVTLALILGIVGFAIFMYNLNKTFGSQLKILSTFHSTLFGYESAMIELIGSRGYKSHVFPKIVSTIKELGDDEAIAAVTQAKTGKEAMEKWLEVLEEAKVTTGSHLVDKGHDEYEINIPHCGMCSPIHAIMGDAKGICPNALVVAAASAVVDEDMVPTIDYSELTPTGSITNLKFNKMKD